MHQKSHANRSLCEIFTEQKFNALCQELFCVADVHRKLHVVRISINCTSFTIDSKKELSLIGFEEEQKMHKLTLHIHDIRQKYGIDMLQWGSEL